MSSDVRSFSAPQMTSGEEGKASRGLFEGRLDLLKDLKVHLNVRLGGCDLSVPALSGLKEGEVLTLDQVPADQVEILLGDAVVARGTLVVVGDYYGVRVEAVSPITT